MDYRSYLEAFQWVATSAFYLVIGTVAVLTYEKVNRRFSSSVNTEHQRMVMERLLLVSEELRKRFTRTNCCNFEEESVACIEKAASISRGATLEYLASLSRLRKWEEGEKARKVHLELGLPVEIRPLVYPISRFISTELPPGLEELVDLDYYYQCDPLLPEDIKKELSQFLGRRCEIMTRIYREVSLTYWDISHRKDRGERLSLPLLSRRGFYNRLEQERCLALDFRNSVRPVLAQIQSYLEGLWKS